MLVQASGEGEPYLNKRVVQHEHDRGSIPGPLLAPEEHLSDIADVSHLGMPETELPSPKYVMI